MVKTVSTSGNKKFLPLALVFLFGGYSILSIFGYDVWWQRLNIDVAGTVVSSVDSPTKGAPRYATSYTIRRTDGSLANYVAGPTIASLPRSMPVGTVILKKKWETGYEIDGHWVEGGAPWPMFALGAVFLVAGISMLVKSFT
jgi:hypothetical protein